MRNLFVLAFFLFAAACGEPAPQAAGIVVTGGWAAPTPGGVDVSAGYVTIINGGADDRLLAASSPRAARVELHEMRMDGDLMIMRGVAALPIAAGETVSLAPGSMHLMFFGVNQPFTEGEDIAVQITFERAGVIDVTLPVRRGAGDH